MAYDVCEEIAHNTYTEKVILSMPRYPETQALLEQALRHVLDEQGKLLKRPDYAQLAEVAVALNSLAQRTSNLLVEGANSSISAASLVKEANQIENLVDDVSESLWTHIPVVASAIYERMEGSLQKKSGKQGLVADARAHYHNLRVRLLNQMLGARMLVLNSDLGDEHERLWQQFLERHLGPAFKVLRGGHVFDHEGNRSESQVDLIVLPADAQVFIPGDSTGGKAIVLVDQIISVIMVTSNLTKQKMQADWQKLQSLPRYSDFEKDFPNLKGHPWPLCYILAAQSDAPEDLKKTWQELVQQGFTHVVPQFVIALDTGFLHCGLRRWPAPRWPGNYVAADDVHIESDINGGLGLAWLIAQHQGRLAVTQHRALGQITRFANLLDEATLREGVPSTYSQRFATMFQMRPITGFFGWGRFACFAHNRLPLRSIERNPGEGKLIYETELFQDGADTKNMEFRTWSNFVRWFHYGVTNITKGYLAVEEWTNPSSKSEHRRKIAVFNLVSGNEIKGPKIDALQTVGELSNIVSEISEK